MIESLHPHPTPTPSAQASATAPQPVYWARDITLQSDGAIRVTRYHGKGVDLRQYKPTPASMRRVQHVCNRMNCRPFLALQDEYPFEVSYQGGAK
jgi:hypothetical protein